MYQHGNPYAAENTEEIDVGPHGINPSNQFQYGWHGE